MSTDHIQVEVKNERVQLVIDDYELFDFVDDFVTDAGLEYEYTSEEERRGRKHYLMHFALGVPVEQVSEMLDGLDDAEVQRIWSLNNA